MLKPVTLIPMWALLVPSVASATYYMGPLLSRTWYRQLYPWSILVARSGLQVNCFIGGLPLDRDKENCKLCHIAIGTPGRVKHLIKENILKVNLIRLFVLDEVDKLMENSFLNDVNEIYNSLPNKTQIITTSATYTEELKYFLQKYMLSPTYVGVHNDTPFLWGLKQFVKVVKHHTNVVQQMKAKTEEILNIFSNISFTQCIIFTNYQVRAESISNTLNQKGWASTYVSAARSQPERIAALNDLKKFNCKIMLSTDLTARGIDAASIDLVINYDVPHDATTYLHRMGRAGRYGASGICINLVSQGAELQQIQNIIYNIEGSTVTIPELPNFTGTLSDLLNMDVLNHFSETPTNSVQIHKACLELEIREIQGDNHCELTEPKPEENKFHVTNGNHGMVESDINNILSNTKREEELFRNQLCNEDTNALLKTLASGECNVDSYKSNNNSSACTQIQQFILNNKYGTSDNNHIPNKTDNTECKSEKVKKSGPQNIGREDILYHKNKALLCVSSIIFDMECNNLIPNNLECIQTYLNILKDEENNYILSIPSQNPVEILNDMNEFLKSKNDNNCNQNAIEIFDDIEHPKPLENPISISSDCLETVFKIGYDFATKPGSKHWNSHFPDLQVKNCASKGQTSDTTDDLYVREETVISNESVVSEEEDLVDSMENVMKWIPVEQNGKTYLPESESDANNSSYEHYYKYFSDYSNYLWENGLSFESVEDFDNWFYYEWQMNVAAVRNYVQQNIYHQEMKKHQDYKVNLI